MTDIDLPVPPPPEDDTSAFNRAMDANRPTGFDREVTEPAPPKRRRPPRRPRSGTEPGAGVPVELTEDAIALDFVEKHGAGVRFCHDTGAWFIWTGASWEQNKTGLCLTRCRELVRAANRPADPKIRRATGNYKFSSGAEAFAKRDPRVSATADTWDADPLALGTPGGTVNLSTGELRPSRPEDYITRLTGTAPAAPGTSCDTWLRFLDQATGRDDDLIRFLQQWCGYCLTGSIREHALVFIYGPGGNGKSVFLNTLAGILGSYNATAAMDTFIDGGARHLTFLAMLAGSRMVTAAETEEGRAWAETKIKEMTGGTPVTANFMRRDPFTFTPQFKITITGNHKPAFKSVDPAVRRRFNIVPFLHEPTTPDRQLEDKLMAEWPAILGWMIEGCLDWQRHGLVRPQIVLDATQEYFDAQDLIGRWLAERCMLDPALTEKPGRLVSDCREWAAANGELPPPAQQFRSALEKVPGLRFKTVNGSRMWAGIGFRTDPASPHWSEGSQGAEGAGGCT